MRIVETELPIELHQRISGVLNRISNDNIMFDILENGRMLKGEYTWLVNDINDWLTTKYNFSLKGYNMDVIVNTGNVYDFDWHTDLSEEDVVRYSSIEPENYPHLTMVYYPNNHQSSIEFEDRIIKVGENKVVIFNGDLPHQIIIDDCKSKRIVLTYMFTIVSENKNIF